MRAILLIIAGLLAGTATARDLPVPPDKGWQHAATGLVLTAKLDGLQRTKLSDNTATEHDVVAEFADPDRSVIATVYLFHPAIDNVAIWFERAQTELEARDLYGGVTPMRAEPLAFTPPSGTAASALRQSYTPHRREYSATALAIVPLGEWLVAVRISAKALDAAALDERMSRILQAIRWPAGANAAAAVPIAACASPLAYGKHGAKLVKPQGSDLLLGLLGTAIANKVDPKPVTPTRWCQDGPSTTDYGVYRTDETDLTAYTIAFRDAGRAIFVYRSLASQIGQGESYSVSLTDVDGSTLAFPSFDRLPRPEQVIELVLKGQPVGRSSTGGKQIDIAPGAIR